MSNVNVDKCYRLIVNYWSLLLITIFRYIFYANVKWGIMWADSFEMLSVDTTKLLNQGILHAIRVPLYPMLLDLSQMLGEKMTILNGEWQILLVGVQIIVSFISVIFFLDTLKKIVKNVQIANAVTTFYACTPIIMGFDTIMLTESFSISGTVIFFWLMVKYLKEQKAKWGILAITLSGILCFLRPTFLMFLAILFFFFLLRFFLYQLERPAIYQCAKAMAVTCIIIGISPPRFRECLSGVVECY